MARAVKKKYIDNDKFYAEMVKYRAELDASPEGEEAPRMNDYLGKCFMDIAKNLAKAGNFSSYPFKDEMIFDGIEDAVRAAKNFNPEKFKSPFNYFTTVIYWAFVRRIQKEKKELYTKYKSYFSSVQSGSLITNSQYSEVDITNHLEKGVGVATEYMDEYVKNYERILEEKKAKKEAAAKEKAELAALENATLDTLDDDALLEALEEAGGNTHSEGIT